MRSASPDMLTGGCPFTCLVCWLPCLVGLLSMHRHNPLSMHPLNPLFIIINPILPLIYYPTLPPSIQSTPTQLMFPSLSPSLPSLPPSLFSGIWSAFGERFRYHLLKPLILRWRWCTHIKRPGRTNEMRIAQIERELSCRYTLLLLLTLS